MAENVEVKLKNVRLSFFHGFKPQERRDDKTKELTGWNYNTSILLDKVEDAAQIDAIKEAMKKARDSQWPDKDSRPRIPADRMCLRDGEPVDEDTGKPRGLYDGYDGCMYLSANRPVSIEDQELIKAGKKDRPITIIGPRKGENGKFKPLEENDEFAPYSGCYANVIIRVYPFSSGDYPARINASLEAIQFCRHGTRFAGSAPIDAESAFDEVEDEDDLGSSGSTGGGTAASDDDLLG